VPYSFAVFANEWALCHNVTVRVVTVKLKPLWLLLEMTKGLRRYYGAKHLHFITCNCYRFHVWSERKRIEKLRYMQRNPVKRGLLERQELWTWSSFRAYLYLRLEQCV